LRQRDDRLQIEVDAIALDGAAHDVEHLRVGELLGDCVGGGAAGKRTGRALACGGAAVSHLFQEALDSAHIADEVGGAPAILETDRGAQLGEVSAGLLGLLGGRAQRLDLLRGRAPVGTARACLVDERGDERDDDGGQDGEDHFHCDPTASATDVHPSRASSSASSDWMRATRSGPS